MKARKLLWFHGVATCVWFALALPTVLFWKQSILWVALMSVWANVAAHFSAYQGARTEVQEVKRQSEDSEE